MQKLFDEVASLDKCCYEKFGLTEDILMEHAAEGMANFIREKFAKGLSITVLCGGGNNGADGIALSRLLHGEYDVSIFYITNPKSKMAILQNYRSHAIGVKSTIELNECDILVDALYGTGFKGEFNSEVNAVMQSVKKLKAYKIACDIPSGLKESGSCEKNTFIADVSLTMGALKKSMFSDKAKDYVGEIKVLDLGIPRTLYEKDSNWNLLDLDDLKLPYRDDKDTHKGTYGHLALACGEKHGASILSAKSALRFGSGLVTLVGNKDINTPDSIMHTDYLPNNSTAIAIGMGLGSNFSDKELGAFLDNSLPIVADADIFKMDILRDILKRDKIVITPHPKEFVSLLKIIGLVDICIEVLQKDRFTYVELFCTKYPNVVLLLKGANVIIGKESRFFINTHGTSLLAKGGSGDVLSGLIGSLLSQGYEPLEASISASLAHTKLAQNYTGADFSLTPEDLIAGIGNL